MTRITEHGDASAAVSVVDDTSAQRPAPVAAGGADSDRRTEPGRRRTEQETKAVYLLRAALERLLDVCATTGRPAPRLAVALDTSRSLSSIGWPATGLAWTFAVACAGMPLHARLAVGDELVAVDDPKAASVRPAADPFLTSPAQAPFGRTVSLAACDLLDAETPTASSPMILLLLSDRRPGPKGQDAVRRGVLSVLNSGGHVLWAYSPGPLMRMPTRVQLHVLAPSAGPDGRLLEAAVAAVDDYARRLAREFALAQERAQRVQAKKAARPNSPAASVSA